MIEARRGAVTASFLLAAAASVLFLERTFERADHDKAERMARAWSAGGDTLEAVVTRSAHGGPVAWQSTIVSGCYGFVRVTAVAAPPGRPSVEHVFDVDLPRLKVTAGNAAAAAALDEALRSARPPIVAPVAPGAPGDAGTEARG